MITGIKKNKHGVLDYMYIPLVFAAPRLVGFEDNKSASVLCRIFSLAVFGYSLLTDAPWGAVKLISYKTHAVLDLTSGVAAFAASGAIKKPSRKKARNTFFLMGLTGIVVGILSLIGAEQE